MKTLTVALPGREYDIVIERGLLDRAGELCRKSLPGASRLFVVTDSTVGPLYLKRIIPPLEAAGFETAVCEIPAGEASKCAGELARLWECMMDFGLTRTDAVVALGGGVVGDLAGFAAATILRGVAFVQIPTTLLAQVDSSVGGKVAIDLDHGKNLAGAFWQPKLVLMDPDTLDTLPDATFADGMAEVVKYGYIANKDILDMVSQPDYKAHIEGIIYECVKIKRDVVAIDEHDTGLRMILNFGHTIGHAAEKLGNYTDLTHGQAVAIGMVAAMRLSALLGNDDLTTPLVSLLQHIGLPTGLTYDRAAVFNALLSDKKKFGATVNFILVREPGRAEITPIEAEKLHEYILKL